MRRSPGLPTTTEEALAQSLGKRNLKEARNGESYSLILWIIVGGFVLFSILFFLNPLLHHKSSNLREIQLTPAPVVTNTAKNLEQIIYPSPQYIMNGCLEELPEPDNRKHIVPPPAGPVTIVCCNTTKGILNIEVHHTWAPFGAEHFLHMVKDGFFSTNVPLFRALKDFLVQFGLAGDPEVQKRYFGMGHLPDDPNWLPEGPSGRERNGTRRFQKGYMAYAGAGKNSRGTQLILAFKDNLYLGGGSPWEVPFGQVFGEESFQTMKNIYTGYGEKPSQGKIMNRGNEYTKAEFPLMDYMNYCVVVRENVPYKNSMLNKP